ncbi:MAG: hypothetical protein ABSG13_12455 [Bryobacteraceae bacterium]|jgi:hypothetical protein
MRKLIILAAAVACLTSASTLQRLTMTDMIQKSTMIVRGTIQPGSSAAFRGSMIYTHYQLSVKTAFKGTPGSTIDVAVPGGVLNGIQQPVAGAPAFTPGQDTIFFLWTSKSGLTQVIGLSQGLFSVTTNAQGQVMVSRGTTSQTMLDSSGQTVSDSSIQMPLTQLVSNIQAVLAGGSAQ